MIPESFQEAFHYHKMNNSLQCVWGNGNFHGDLFWRLTIYFFEKHNKDVVGSFCVMVVEQEVFFCFI